MGKRKKIIVGTRGSILALAQANIVTNKLKEFFPEYSYVLKTIRTSGDLNKKESLLDESLKNMFVKEIELELQEGKIDIAVHSMKDMPVEMPEGLCIGAIPKREDCRDVLISRSNIKFTDLPKGAVIGTSSLRRMKQLELLRGDIKVKEIRGNIETRIKKTKKEYDAVILAAAGLKRIGLDNLITEYFDAHRMIPACGQGALCIQYRKDDEDIRKILQKINDTETSLIITAEREFIRILEGGCKVPIGVNGVIKDKKLLLQGIYFFKDRMFKDKIQGDKLFPEKCASTLAKRIKDKINE